MKLIDKRHFRKFMQNLASVIIEGITRVQASAFRSYPIYMQRCFTEEQIQRHTNCDMGQAAFVDSVLQASR